MGNRRKSRVGAIILSMILILNVLPFETVWADELEEDQIIEQTEDPSAEEQLVEDQTEQQPVE